MQIVITMAGLGMRFREAGYTVPKYMIEARGKSLFEWSMDSLADYNPHVTKYIFVVRSDDAAGDFIRKKCELLGIGNIRILELDHRTDGQATTCMMAMKYCDPEDSILVYNIDTYVEPFEMRYEDISGDGHIPCFKAEGTHWSFVRVDDNGNVTEIREKKRISDNCTLGAYYFSSARLYMDLYNEYYDGMRETENNEKYIAPLYNLMLEKKMPISISIIGSDKVHVLGTPEELEVFMREDGGDA